MNIIEVNGGDILEDFINEFWICESDDELQQVILLPENYKKSDNIPLL